MSEFTKRRAKYMHWLRNPYHLILLLIIIIALIIRIHYFVVAGEQAVWWDEAEYLLQAKHHAFDTPNTGWAGYTREPFMPMVWSVFFKIGFGEAGIKFIQVIFSLLTVYLTYLVGQDLFSKRVGLIAAAFMAVFHHNLFFSIRGLLAIPSLLSWLLAIHLFWKGYISKDTPVKRRKWYLIFAAISVALGFEVYYSIGFLIPIILIFLLVTDRFKFIKSKNLWIAAIVCLIVLSPFLITAYKTQGTALPKLTATVVKHTEDISYGLQGFMGGFNHIPFFLQTLLFILFIVGIIIILFNLIVGFDYLIKGKEVLLKQQFFVFLWLLIPLLIFGWLGINRDASAIEPRYLIAITPALFLVSAHAMSKLADFVKKVTAKKYKEVAAVVFIVVIVLIGGYYQLNAADDLIKGKAGSYIDLKQAGLWVKENSEPGDVIINSGVPQNTYYTERETYGFPKDIEKFNELVAKKKPKYGIVSVWEPSPDWAYVYPQTHQEEVKVVQAYSLESEPDKPRLIIWEFLY